MPRPRRSDSKSRPATSRRHPPKVFEGGVPSKLSPFEIRAESIKLQYELLSILDSKASALLTFDAIALTSLSIWLGYIPLNYMHAALDIVFLCMLVSCGSLLFIIWLRWASNEEDEVVLNEIRVRRTRHYQFSWYLSVVGIAAIVIVSLVHTTGTFLISTDNCGPTCQYFFSERVFGNLDYGVK